MADNKVVIKINYDKKQAGLSSQPQTVTVWHTRRILIAVLAIVLVILLLFSLFSGDGNDSDTQINSAEKVQQLNPVEAESVAQQPSPAVENTQPVVTPKQPVKSESAKVTDTVKRPAAVILDRKVIRASLNSKPKDKEPGEPIKSPVRVNQNQPVELFYFSEIKNMKAKVLFHQWRRNGQLVLQKQLDTNAYISKVWTSKTVSVKDKGEWQVQLADKKGKVYSEVNFVVDTE